MQLLLHILPPPPLTPPRTPLVVLFLWLFLSVQFGQSTLTILDSNATTFPCVNAFDKENSFNRDNFTGLVIPLTFKPPCQPIQPLLQYTSTVVVKGGIRNITSSFNNGVLLFLVGWIEARSLGCLNQGEAESAVRTSVLPGLEKVGFNTSKWLMLFNGAKFDNGYDSSSPMINSFGLVDSINVGPRAAEYLQYLFNLKKVGIPVSIKREPGEWNLLFKSSLYLSLHWSIFALNAIGLVHGLYRLVSMIYQRRKFSSILPKRYALIDAFLYLKFNGIAYFLVALFGLYERAVPAGIHVLQYGYWILTIWSYCGMQFVWARIAYKVQKKALYKYFTYFSLFFMSGWFFSFILITIGMVVHRAYFSFLIGYAIFFGASPVLLLIYTVIYEIITIRFLLFAAELNLSPKALVYVRLVTIAGLMLPIVILPIVVIGALFVSPFASSTMVYLAEITVLPLAGFLLQMVIFSLPLGQSLDDPEDTFNRTTLTIPPPTFSSSDLAQPSNFTGYLDDSTQLETFSNFIASRTTA